jgi:hypothetical protein
MDSDSTYELTLEHGNAKSRTARTPGAAIQTTIGVGSSGGEKDDGWSITKPDMIKASTNIEITVVKM